MWLGHVTRMGKNCLRWKVFACFKDEQLSRSAQTNERGFKWIWLWIGADSDADSRTIIGLIMMMVEAPWFEHIIVLTKKSVRMSDTWYVFFSHGGTMYACIYLEMLWQVNCPPCYAPILKITIRLNGGQNNFGNIQNGHTEGNRKFRRPSVVIVCI